MCRSEWQRPQRSMRTSTSPPYGFGVSTMVSHSGASNLTRDCRRINAIFLPPKLSLCFTAYIGQFTGHGNKAGNRNGLRAPRRVDARSCGEPRGIGAERLQALPQHLAALAEGGGGDLFEQLAIAGERRFARDQSNDGRRDLRRRHEGGRPNVE